MHTVAALVAIVQRVVVIVLLILELLALLLPVVVLERVEALALDLLARVLVEDAHLGRALPLPRRALWGDGAVRHDTRRFPSLR